MPRNGAGIFNVFTPGTPYVNGTVIDENVANSVNSDFATGLTNSIAKDGQTPAAANLPMATFRHTGVGNAAARNDYAAAGQVQDGTLSYGSTSGGSGNAQTINLTPAISAYVAGMGISFIAGFTNTSAATIAVNGLAAKSIQVSGSALTGGEIVAGRIYQMIYDGTAFNLQGSVSSTVIQTEVSARYGAAVWLRRAGADTNAVTGGTYGNGLYVLTGGSGTTRVQTSSDTFTWTLRTTSNAVMNAAAYGASTFVIVGNGGVINSSSDGITWTSRTSGTVENLRAATFAAGLFVVVGNNSTIITSPDGITWTARTTAVTTLTDIVWSGSLFAACGGTGGITTSPDGITWTDRTAAVGASTDLIRYGLGIFYMSNQGTPGATGAQSSTDAITWTARSNNGMPFNSVQRLEYHSPTRQFVVLGQSSDIATSVSPITGATPVWDEIGTEQIISGNGTALVYLNGFLIAGWQDGSILVS